MQTVPVSPAEMKKRLVRFKDLVPYSQQHQSTNNIPSEVMEILTANKVYSVMAPESYAGRSAMAPIKSLPGAVISIAECPPGNGPALHCHEQTVENFFCLNGRFEITWGDEGENSLILEPLDFISIPPKVSRAFRNISDETARLFVVIQPPPEMQTDRVAYPRLVGEQISQKYGEPVLDALKDIGFKFNAGMAEN